MFKKPVPPLDPSVSEPSDLEAVALQNRKILENATGSALTKELTYTTDVWLLKIAMATLYGFAMWYLVFGFMGFFQQHLHHPSPAMRYVSDSSYWLYLLHLPLTFWLAMYLAPLELGFFGKFALYNLLLVAILMPTYHYLVRSTWVGRLLNGKSYPYKPFFQSDLFRSNDQVRFEQAIQLETDTPSMAGTARLPTEAGTAGIAFIREEYPRLEKLEGPHFRSDANETAASTSQATNEASGKN